MARGGHSVLWYSGFSSWGRLLLGSTGSGSPARGLGGWDFWAPEHRLSSASACGIFQDQEDGLMSPASAGRFLTTEPPESAWGALQADSTRWDHRWDQRLHPDLLSAESQALPGVYCIGICSFNETPDDLLWRREWQPTPVFWPGGLHGWRNLVGYSLWALKESDTTDWLTHTDGWPVCTLRFERHWSTVLWPIWRSPGEEVSTPGDRKVVAGAEESPQPPHPPEAHLCSCICTSPAPQLSDSLLHPAAPEMGGGRASSVVPQSSRQPGTHSTLCESWAADACFLEHTTWGEGCGDHSFLCPPFPMP